MREIRFRGKRVDNGGWVYGFLVRRPSAVQIGSTSPWAIIVPPSDPDDSGGEYWVVAESIGQYTGLKDKNGTEIYEGDILHKDCFWSRFIEFEKGSFVSAPLNKVQYNNRKFYPIGCSDYQDWEVIENIYENPEMLEA